MVAISNKTSIHWGLQEMCINRSRHGRFKWQNSSRCSQRKRNMYMYFNWSETTRRCNRDLFPFFCSTFAHSLRCVRKWNSRVFLKWIFLQIFDHFLFLLSYQPINFSIDCIWQLLLVKIKVCLNWKCSNCQFSCFSWTENVNNWKTLASLWDCNHYWLRQRTMRFISCEMSHHFSSKTTLSSFHSTFRFRKCFLHNCGRFCCCNKKKCSGSCKSTQRIHLRTFQTDYLRIFKIVQVS